MPDLVTHFGTSYLGFRLSPWGVDLRLIFLGALLPDLPWIAARVLRTAGADPIDLYAILIPFSTPFVVVVLAGALALMHDSRAKCFATVAVAGLLHVALDALQTRPADGPLLFYPFSFQQFSLSWFWPESTISYVAAAVSAVALLIALWPPIPPNEFRLRKTGIGLIGLLLCAALAFATRENLIEHDVYSLGFASDPGRFEGQSVAIERDTVTDGNLVAVSPSRGLRVRLAGVSLDPGEKVSVVGVYRDGAVHVQSLHRHNPGLRDLLSYLGLLLFAAVWVDVPGWLRARWRITLS